jgi:hypothetical protein
MALIIEDGTGKEDAQSYITAGQARVYAQARGVTLSGTDSVVEAQLVNAMDYLQSKGPYKGKKTYPAVQALLWPRTCAEIDGEEYPDDSIPSGLKSAQAQLVIEQANGNDLMPSSNGQIVKREKVDVIETEYMTGTETGSSGGPEMSFPKVDALLAPLIDGGSFALRSVRL